MECINFVGTIKEMLNEQAVKREYSHNGDHTRGTIILINHSIGRDFYSICMISPNGLIFSDVYGLNQMTDGYFVDSVNCIQFYLDGLGMCFRCDKIIFEINYKDYGKSKE